MIVRTPDLDPMRPWQFFAEEERSSEGEIVQVNTLFLTNRECPWRCVMCDLWKNTLTESVPVGAIPMQIEYALSRLPDAAVIKLYNSGSFFDPRAIPVADYPAIAGQLARYDRVIVESHPALIGENCLRFRDLIAGRLEVAMGLETVHPEILPKLNKGMTLEQFSLAANALQRNSIDLRAFILVKPPFLSEQEALYWAERSLDFAFSCGAAAAALIPTRGAAPPRIETLEASHEYGLRLRGGRVFADLWDLEKFAVCGGCYTARHNRLREMNLRQTIPGPIDCDVCGERA
jgi:archaeosine synthase beta-subunit